jgi:hypothetical protein
MIDLAIAFATGVVCGMLLSIPIFISAYKQATKRKEVK